MLKTLGVMAVLPACLSAASHESLAYFSSAPLFGRAVQGGLKHAKFIRMIFR